MGREREYLHCFLSLDSFAIHGDKIHSRWCMKMISAAPCTCGVRSSTAPSHSRSHYDKHINDCHSRWRAQPRFRLIERKAPSSELCKHSGSIQLTGILSRFTPEKQRFLTHYVPSSLVYNAVASNSIYFRCGDAPEVVDVQQHDLCEHCRSRKHLGNGTEYRTSLWRPRRTRYIKT